MESIHVNYIIKKPTIDSIKQFINDKNLTNKPLFIYTIKNTDDFNCLSRVEIIFDNLSYYFFSNAVSKYFIYNDSQLTESMLTNVHTLFVKDLTL